MLPIQLLEDFTLAPLHKRLYRYRCLGVLLLLFVMPCSLRTISAQEESRAPKIQTSAPIDARQSTPQPNLWTAEQVASRAIQADPLCHVLRHERRLLRSQPSGHKSNCSVQGWLTSHLDQRIVRRQQEVRAQILKLHFGLAEIQSQTLVLDELHLLLGQFTDMVAKVADVQEATEVLDQKREDLALEVRNIEIALHNSLAQLRAQLRGLLPGDEAQQYWPAEPIVIHFQEVDVEQQVLLAKQQRTDISIWSSTPRIEGNVEELTRVEQLLASHWWLIPSSVSNSALLKMLAVSHNSHDLKRRWMIRQQQIEELARAKTLEMDTEVRLKAIAVQQAYQSAEQTQLRKRQATEQLAVLQKRQTLGFAQLDRYWEVTFQEQRLRSELFRKLNEARQAEIELDLSTASNRFGPSGQGP